MIDDQAHDEDLVQRVQTGQRVKAGDDQSRKAFEQLVSRHQARLRASLRQMTRGDTALADNLAQEAFLLAWQKIATFRFEAQFSTWLHQIALRAFLSHARKPKEVLWDDLDVGDVRGEIMSGADTADGAAPIDIARAVRSLPDIERAVVTACYFSDLSHAEAAIALDVPLGSLKTHLANAKNRLRDLLVAYA